MDYCGALDEACWTCLRSREEISALPWESTPAVWWLELQRSTTEARTTPCCGSMAGFRIWELCPAAPRAWGAQSMPRDRLQAARTLVPPVRARLFGRRLAAWRVLACSEESGDTVWPRASIGLEKWWGNPGFPAASISIGSLGPNPAAVRIWGSYLRA